MEVTETYISYDELLRRAEIRPGVIRDYVIDKCGCIWAPEFWDGSTFYEGFYLDRCPQCAEEVYYD